jgi:biopolymer transport protein ExbD
MLYDIGNIGLNDVSWDDLESTIRAEVDLNPELIVLVKIQREARYETMVDMLDTLDTAHMTRFSVIQMSPEDETRIEES